MKAHSFVNVVIPFDRDCSDQVNAVLKQWTDDAKGNSPTEGIEASLRRAGGIHFMSMTVVMPRCPAEKPESPAEKLERPAEKDAPAYPAPVEKPYAFSGLVSFKKPSNSTVGVRSLKSEQAHLLIEISSDHGANETLTLIADVLGPELNKLLSAADVKLCGQQLGEYLIDKSVVIGAKWGAKALGQVFSGSPGMTVQRICEEGEMAAFISDEIATRRKEKDWHALSLRQRVDAIRDKLWRRGYKWAFIAEPAPCLAGDPHNSWNEDTSVANPQVWKAAWLIASNLLWPLLLLYVALAFLILWNTATYGGPMLCQTPASSVALALLPVGLVTLYSLRRWPRVAFAALLVCGALYWRYGDLYYCTVNYHNAIVVAAIFVIALLVNGALRWPGLLVLALLMEVLTFGYSGPNLELIWIAQILIGLSVATALLMALRLGFTRGWFDTIVVALIAYLVVFQFELVSRFAWTLVVMSGLLLALVVAVAVFFAVVFLRLRWLEKTDAVEDQLPSAEHVKELLSVENFCVQNHLASVSRLKGGWLRKLTLRIAFAVVETGPFVCPPGFLGKNGVIHFARWMRIPGTDQMLFFSNYDGTWESYVADFIADAPQGVTAIWSNCIGFPRSEKLFSGGAKDRNKLMPWARRQQHPTTFWYSAYPKLTAERIRVNAAIRQGFASAESDADIRDWFDLFSSSPRRPDELLTSQISSLVFGGMKRLPYAECYAIRLDGDLTARKRWFSNVASLASYGELLPGQKSAVVVALSARGLTKLIPQDKEQEFLRTFPVAFQQGMAMPARARLLSDDGANHPTNWKWDDKFKATNEEKSVDVLFILYGVDPEEMNKKRKHVLESMPQIAHVIEWIPLANLSVGDGSAGHVPANRKYETEAFGFVDGVSQPILRSAPGAHGARNPNDLVAAGEIILGYPDNLDTFPPSPSIEDKYDPQHFLPDVGPELRRRRPEFSRYEGRYRRDLGWNGTYLVVRQLEQDVAAFVQFIDSEARRVIADMIVATDGGKTAIEWGAKQQDTVDGLPLARPRYDQLPTAASDVDHVQDAIAAKMIGRHKDGTSLVRNPLMPGRQADPKAEPDNKFLLGAEDARGLRCPLGAHIRRANPRDTRFPGSQEEIASVNRHRILRVGRSYTEGNAENKEKKGLLFMCLNADIERQFEFIQKTWLLNPNIHGLQGEKDPILGRGERKLTIPTVTGPIELKIDKDFVTMRGGGYFFLPGRAVLRYLAWDDPDRENALTGNSNRER